LFLKHRRAVRWLWKYICTNKNTECLLLPISEEFLLKMLT
jgi:hypothetical protein